VNTWTSASFFIYAAHFKAENITFENNAGFTAGQAVAVFASGDQTLVFQLPVCWVSGCAFLFSGRQQAIL